MTTAKGERTMATRTICVGLCSRQRAVDLMGVAAGHAIIGRRYLTSGGAIYVGLPAIEGLTVDAADDALGYLAVGRLPSGESIPTLPLDPVEVLARLAAADADARREGETDIAVAIASVIQDLRTRVSPAPFSKNEQEVTP